MRSGPRVYGCCGESSRSAVGPDSTMRPAYMTHTSSASPAIDRQVMRDPDHRGAGFARELLHLEDDLRLDRDVERGGRLVGDDDARVVAAARSQSRRAGACRRRIDADSSRAARRARECRRGRARCATARAPVRGSRAWCASTVSIICVSMRSTGFSVIIGSWKIIAMRSPRNRAHRIVARAEQIVALRARTRPPTMRPGGSTSPMIEKPVTVLPEPDSPTSPSTLPASTTEAHIVDRLDDARLGEEMRLSGPCMSSATSDGAMVSVDPRFVA